jgi:hypothetical protein
MPAQRSVRPNHPGERPPHVWRRAVLLAHTPTGEAEHLDLLLAPPLDPSEPAARPGDDERVCATWRLPAGAPLGEAGRSIEAERLPDHRALYLTYEGAMSGGRGTVRRVATGRCAAGGELESGSGLHLVLELSGIRSLIHATRTGGAGTPPLGGWRFRVIAAEPITLVSPTCAGSGETGCGACGSACKGLGSPREADASDQHRPPAHADGHRPEPG